MLNKLIRQTVNFFSKNENVIFPRQITWPINSNKHLQYATEDYNNLIKNFLNEKR